MGHRRYISIIIDYFQKSWGHGTEARTEITRLSLRLVAAPDAALHATIRILLFTALCRL